MQTITQATEATPICLVESAMNNYTTCPVCGETYDEEEGICDTCGYPEND